MKIVFAIGGNALGSTPEEQLTLAYEVATPILELIQAGHQIVIVHGNGPQVGLIKTSLDIGHKHNAKIPFVNLNHAGAMSQGYIGYSLQQAFRVTAAKMGLPIQPVTVVTQVEVDPRDPAFQHPTKPIGDFCTLEEAELMRKQGFTMVEDSGRGYRQVVPSPKPQHIVEKDAINTLIQSGYLVIAGGGGGIPVVRDGFNLKGIDAVIDKDFASSKLADLIDADRLILLTAVSRVMVNYGKPNAKPIEKMNLKEASQYIKEGQFAPGSMLPKVEAAILFVKDKQNRQAIIASLKETKLAINGLSGTAIINR
jgi:carbamate kinase